MIYSVSYVAYIWCGNPFKIRACWKTAYYHEMCFVGRYQGHKHYTMWEQRSWFHLEQTKLPGFLNQNLMKVLIFRPNSSEAVGYHSATLKGKRQDGKGFFGHEWNDSPLIFTSGAITSENYWRITSRVTKNSLFTAIHESYMYMLSWGLKHRKIDENSLRSISVSLYGGLVSCGIVTSRKHIIWRHVYRLLLKTFLSGSRVPSHRRHAD